MIRLCFASLLCLSLGWGEPTESEVGEIQILVFSKTAGFRHGSISNGIAALEQMALDKGFGVTFTEDADVFTEERLQAYTIIFFLNTTRDILNESQQMAMQTWYRAGGGFIGVHAAADTEYDWPWYNELLGAWFNGHPRIQAAEMDVVDSTHISTKHLARRWRRSDEWYNYRDLQPYINPLLNLDENTYDGGTMGGNHPISWYHEFEGGRVFYTGMGHTGGTYEEPEFLEHLWGGIQYVCGESSTPVPQPEIRIQARAILQGLFSGEEMRTNLLDNGLLPLTDPFLQQETVDTLPADVVDWVLIQVRDSGDYTQIIAQKPGFLRKDGTLLGRDRNEGVILDSISQTTAYVSLLHRNHLGVLTATPVELSASIDFSDVNTPVMGNDSRDIQGGRAMLFVGDYDGNSLINNQDFNLWKQNSAALDIYTPVDGDGNGIVNNLDFNLWRVNGSKIGVPGLGLPGQDP